MDEKEEEVTSIRVYGLNESNENICVRINNFTPFVYLELPESILWTSSKAQMICNKLDNLLGDKKPLVKRLMYKKRLYYAHINSNGKRKTFPYLFLSFSHQSDIRILSYKIRKPINVIGVGIITIKMHEQDASPILQFTSYRNISTAGWCDFAGKKVHPDEQKTLCEHEYKVKWKNFKPNKKNNVASPLIMSFDIEVNSTNPSAMPKAEKPGDKIFQVSCVLFRHGDDEKNMEKYLLTLGEPDPKTTGEDIEIYMYETEHDLLIGYTEFIQEKNPNVIIGYNILNFDIPYMIDRAKMNYCIDSFDQQGFLKYGHAAEKTIKWSSSAYGNQTFQFLDAEGRLYVDLLPLVKRDYKMDNYKLKTISTHFLGSTKDPLSVKGIFKCYRIGIKHKDGVYSKQAKKAMGIVSKYCVQDSVLVVRLFNKLQTWIGLCEMAKTCNVPIFYLYTQGQQIKVYSQLYKYCLYNDFVVEKDGYIPKDDEHYVGATVFEPKAGVYDRVLPFDFASLYPTTIIAYNIDYSTLVNDPNIPDSKCHVMDWEDHVGCSHDKTVRKTKPKHTMCCKRHFRFLKEPKGVMPTVLENLLSARSYTRKQIKILKKIISEEKINDKETESVRELIPNILNKLDNITDYDKTSMRALCDVLDKRQLAYKVSANSMYGAMGVTRGYLPFMPGAMCLDGDSKISYSYGYTRKLKDIKNTKLIWAYDNNRQVISNGNGLKYNGKREVVKITLIDGRTIRCTPDHKIMTENGWIEASKMVPKYKWTKNSLSLNENCSKVIVGTELPEDIITDSENGWSLLDYTMNTEDDRTKTLAFCRILGFILSDGTISKYTRLNKDIIESSVYIGTLLDANMFVNDIEILTNKRPSICNCKRENIKGSSYVVHIPKILVNKIIMLEDIIIGKRSHQPYTLPKFLLEDYCPLSIIREFLGGLFGGDGTSPSLSVSHPSFSPVCFGLATIEKYKDNMNTTMNNLIMLLNKFDLNFWQVENKPSRIREQLKPKDYKENPRWEYLIRSNTSSSLKFAKKIGFRYCSDKTNKLSVASSYQRFSDNTRKQHTNIVIKASEIYSSSKNSIQNSLNKAREEEYKQEIPINEYYSLASCTSVYNHRTRPNKLQNVKLLSKYFPTAREYTKLVKCEHWFSDKKTGNKIYSLNRTDISSPCIILDVIDIRYDGVDDVYDIVDVPQHSFLANGIVVHNCTTAMGRKNIGIVAKTIPEKFGGELIYGDTDCVLPDCPVLVKNKNGFIEYMTMEEISDGNWKPTPTGKQISQSHEGLSVWSDIGFTRIKHIIRNSIAKPLIRVTTHTGSVECSLDHSLLWENGDAAKGKDVKIGDKLCISEMPLPEDTPKEPLYPNKLTTHKIEEYIIPETLILYGNDEYINCEIAFVWGLFYADGSCGKYPSKASWAINNQDNKLLNKCLNILNKHENNLNFIIMDTMKSSGVNKLSPRCKNKNGSIISLVKKYRDMFYDQRRSKRIPNIIFNSPFDIRQSFFMGYYAGDGSKKDPAISCSNKGAIGSAGLFYLMKTIGYKVSINVRKDKPDIYKLTGSSPTQKFRYCPNKVKKIEETAIRNSIVPLEKPPNFIPPPEYIYDIETENHHFAAGVGQLVVHNSNYIVFPHLKTAQENWDHALYVASEVTKMFPAPIVLEFEEEIYWRFFILTKKRYMYKKCGRDGVVEEKVGKKGVLLARRDNSVFIRNIYETLIMKVFNKSPKDEILGFVIDEINKLCSGYYPYTDFIITKAVGDHGNLEVTPFFNEKNQKKGKMGQYTVPLLSTEPKERIRQFKLKDCNTPKDYYIRCLPAVVQLAERMRFRGQRVDSGTRLEYVISTQGGHKSKQYEKVEDSEYFKHHRSVLRIDYLYYLKLMTNPFDDVLNVLYTDTDKDESNSKYKFSKDLVLNQYKHRSKIRVKMQEELISLLGIKLQFKDK